MAKKPQYEKPSDDKLADFLAKHGNGDAVYRALRAESPQNPPARDLVRSWLRAIPKTYDAPEDVTVSREDILAAELADANKRLRATKKLEVQEERLYQMVAEAVQTTPSLLPKPKPPKKGRQAPANTLIAPLSDTHSGEIVDLEAMDGINEYNWDIMEERIVRWVEAIVSHKDHYSDPIQRIVVPGVGDMLSGQNHEELEVTNEFPIAEQCWKFSHTFAEAISWLAQEFEKVDVIGVPGNHPRMKKQPANKQVFNNFDWLMYETAGLRLQNVPNVNCQFTKAGQHVYDIAGKNFFIWHGDGIRSSMPGVPWGGVMRRVNAIRSDYTTRGIMLDYFILGHFHQANVVQNVFMNGSVKGSDEYVKKNFGGGEPARQLLINFSETHRRVTGVHYLDLQEVMA